MLFGGSSFSELPLSTTNQVVGFASEYIIAEELDLTIEYTFTPLDIKQLSEFDLIR